MKHFHPLLFLILKFTIYNPTTGPNPTPVPTPVHINFLTIIYLQKIPLHPSTIPCNKLWDIMTYLF